MQLVLANVLSKRNLKYRLSLLNPCVYFNLLFVIIEQGQI